MRIGHQHHLRGFTLVELLVVIGVVVLLLGLLLPVLGRAREQAQRVACQSNLRQWASAMLMYTNQNAGWLPRRGQGAQPATQLDRPADWFNALPPLLRVRPLSELAGTEIPSEWFRLMCPVMGDSVTGSYFTLAMNIRLSTWVAPTPDRINRVGPASTLVFMADGPGTYCSVLPSDKPYSPPARHRGWVNLSFLDGHVASLRGQEIGAGIGEIDRADVRWKVPNSPWLGPGQ